MGERRKKAKDRTKIDAHVEIATMYFDATLRWQQYITTRRNV